MPEERKKLTAEQAAQEPGAGLNAAKDDTVLNLQQTVQQLTGL